MFHKQKLCHGIFCVAAVLLLCTTPVFAEKCDDSDTDGLIVTFDDSVSNKKVKEVIEKAEGECEDIDQFSSDEKVAMISADDEEETEKALEQNSYVNTVQPNYIYHFTNLTTDPFSDKNEEYYQYYLDQLNVSDAWDILDKKVANGRKVKVGIIDSGVDVHHEDLQANLADTTKYSCFLYGSEYDMTDDSGEHGTHVSGIIGATADNGKGGSGVASGHNNNYIQMFMAGASDDGDSISSYGISEGLHYLEEKGVQVINMSFGQNTYDYYLDQQMHEAYEQGIILVAASGNDGDSDYNYPAAFGDVISVNASNENKQVSYYSNFGESTDISAPGTSVVSTIPCDKYGRMSGTSMATPVTTSVIAMMLYANPDLTHQQVYDILCGTTDREIGSFANACGYGVIDAYQCVNAAYNLKNATAATDAIYTKQDSFDITVNVPKSLNILLSPSNASGDVSYFIEDESIAKIDHEMIWGVKPGETTLTIRSGDVTKVIPVKVTGTENDFLTSISIRDASLIVPVGFYASDPIIVDTVPASYSGTISYDSSDNSVAIVEDGYIAGIKKGSCTITAKAENGMEATVEVIVKDAIDSVKFTKYKSWMKVGDSCSFVANAYDTSGGSDVYDSGLKYISSNPDVASIDQEGNVKAVGEGYCYLYAESSGLAVNGVSSYCRDSVRLQVSEKSYSGADYQFVYKNGTLSWKNIPGISNYVIESSEDGKTFTSYKKLSGTSLSVSKAKKQIYRLKAGYIEDGQLTYFGYSNKIMVNADFKNYNLKKVKMYPNKQEYKLTWNPCLYAKGYYIFRKSGKGAYSKIASLGAISSYRDTSVKSGTKYTYQVKAYACNDVYSSSGAVTIVTDYSGKDYNLKVKNHKLTWKKASAATGYEIQRKTKNGKFHTIAKVKAVSSYIDKKASKTKTVYKYRIRGIYDKNHMGWSVTK